MDQALRFSEAIYPNTIFLLNKKPNNQTAVAEAIRAGQGSSPPKPLSNQTPKTFNPIPINMPDAKRSLRAFELWRSDDRKTHLRCSRKATMAPASRPITVADTGTTPIYVSAT